MLNTLLSEFGVVPGERSGVALGSIDFLIDNEFMTLTRHHYGDSGVLYEAVMTEACEEEDYAAVFAEVPAYAVIVSVKPSRMFGGLYPDERTVRIWAREWHPSSLALSPV